MSRIPMFKNEHYVEQRAFYPFLKQLPKGLLLTAMAMLLLAQTALATVIKPEDAKDDRDILVVSGKRSFYYTLNHRSLVYKVKGPQRIKIYSRGVLTQKTDQSTSFGFEFQINGNQPLQIHHQQQWSKGVKSPQHPNHYYTKAAKDFITIPRGVNELIIRPFKHTDPVLLRVLEDQHAPAGKKQRLDALSEEAPVRLISNGKRVRYYSLKKGHPLFINLEGPVNLELTSRLAFDPQMGREEDYRLQVRDKGKVLGTYYLSTSRSEQTTVEGRSDLVPGKWRRCNIKLGPGTHEIKLRLLDEQRQVFIKMNQILGE